MTRRRFRGPHTVRRFVSLFRRNQQWLRLLTRARVILVAYGIGPARMHSLRGFSKVEVSWEVRVCI